MRASKTAFAIVLILAVSAPVASAQDYRDIITSMRLLTRREGWASTGKRLFWTADNGSHWGDITPSPGDWDEVASVFFLNTSVGWVLLSRSSENGPRLSLASTIDSGITWSTGAIHIPNLNPKSIPLSGSGQIGFFDTAHGWMNLGVVSSAAAHLGLLLMTEDGGQTWSWAPGGSAAGGNARFVNTNDGWTVSPEGDELYVTHDGAKSWQIVSLPASDVALPPNSNFYNLPVFQDRRRGLLPVTFSSASTSTLVLFATGDGGLTWKPNKHIPGLKPTWSALPSDVAGSTLITAAGSGNVLTLNTADLEKSDIRMNRSDVRRIASVDSIYALSFVTKAEGWVLAAARNCAPMLVKCMQLLSTSDGGVNWANIAPPSVNYAPLITSEDFPTPFATGMTQGTSGKNGVPKSRSFVRSPTELTHVSTHLGFDKSLVIGIADMETWWASSPYYDTSIYLPKAPNRGKDPNLNTAWINSAESQGWGLIPIWFGLQAPCACDPLLPPPCTPFPHTIPSDSSNNYVAAYNAGISEASAALQQASALAVSSGIIYHDIESYAPDGGSCSAAVTRFLSGWDTQLKSVGSLAGVYGNAFPAQNDFTQASPLPDDVWITTFNHRATIWNLGKLKNSNWAVGQRINQYTNTHQENWGNNNPYKIDNDIEDSPVVGATGAKSFAWTLSSLDYPNSISSQGAGINNYGTIAGTYSDSNGVSHGFIYSNSAFSSFDFPGASSTWGTGINNQNEISCSYNTGNFYTPIGCLYSTAKCAKTNRYYCTVDFVGSFSTWAVAINDDTQIVGTYQPCAGCDIDSYLWDAHNGSYASLSDGSAHTTIAEGINGDATISGYYCIAQGCQNYGGPFTGFLYNNTNYADFTFPGATSTYVYGINNNGHVVGYFYDSTGAEHGFFYGDGNSYQIDYAGASYTYVQGVNDLGTVVGTYVDSSNVFHGFVGKRQ